MKARIRLDTFSDVRKFVKTASRLRGRVYVTDGHELKVNAKSLLNMIPTLKFEELWCESENDVYFQIRDFLID